MKVSIPSPMLLIGGFLVRAWMSKGSLLSSIQDMVGIKTGLLITDDDIFRLMRDTSYSNRFESIRNLDNQHLITLRGEEFEEIISIIRVKLGNRDSVPAPFLLKLALDFPEYQDDLAKLVKALSEYTNKNKGPLLINQEFHNKLKEMSGAGEFITILFIKDLIQTLDHSVTNKFTIEEWDGEIPLSDLFQSENLPDNKEKFIDQRFIDYLHAQNQDVDGIHWRQFEALTAEFFRRNGYIVTLGKGRNDGGIDVYAVKENKDSKKPEAIIIQCKRHKESNKVGVNIVKALYFDIIDKEVDKGIVATTSYLEPQGKRICDSKKYPIDYAELDKVKNWIDEMKSKSLLRY